jgi:hypothetical protein
MQTNYTVIIDDSYTPPEGQILTNEEYVNFVMNKAAESYQNQYQTQTVDEGITAAREAYNASVHVTEPVQNIQETLNLA